MALLPLEFGIPIDEAFVQFFVVSEDFIYGNNSVVNDGNVCFLMKIGEVAHLISAEVSKVPLNKLVS